MGRRNKPKKPAAPEPEFEVDPFAALSASDFPAADPTPDPKPEPEPAADPALPYPKAAAGDLVLQLEKKGRRGKTVTILHGLPMDAEAEVMRLAAELKRLLGAGGAVKSDALELQGDQRRRVTEWLRKQGLKVRGDCG